MTIAALATALPLAGSDQLVGRSEAPVDSFAAVLAAMAAAPATAQSPPNLAAEQVAPQFASASPVTIPCSREGGSPELEWPRSKLWAPASAGAWNMSSSSPRALLSVDRPGERRGEEVVPVDPAPAAAKPVDPRPISPTPEPVAAEPPSEQHHRAPVLPARAAVFNERGLFRAIGTMDDRSGTSTSVPTLPTVVDGIEDAASIARPQRETTAGRSAEKAPVEPFEPETDLPSRSTVRLAQTTPAAPPPATAAPASSIGFIDAPASDPAAPAPTIARAALPARAGQPTGSTPDLIRRIATSTDPAASRRAAPKAAPEPRPDEAAQARLHLEAAPEGLTILAAVTRADRDERLRLRDRIAGLLSRHGFAPIDVRLVGASSLFRKDR